MRLPRVLSHRFRSLFRRARTEAELQLEMEIHLEQLTKAYVSDGMSEAEARRTARREFGSLESAKEQCRDKRGTRFIINKTMARIFYPGKDPIGQRLKMGRHA